MIAVTTSRGSVYYVDQDAKRFRKVTTTDESLVPLSDWDTYKELWTRTDVDEPYDREPKPIQVGQQLLFWDLGTLPWLRTSFVVVVEKVA